MANDKDFILKNAIEVGGSTKVTIGDAPASGSYTVGYADMSTWVYDSVSFDTASQGGPFGIVFKSDGTKMYVLSGFTPDSIYQYSLSTAWDISTASYDSVSLNVSGQDADMYYLAVSSDGASFYVIGDSGNNVYQYNLSTAWDLSTASYSQSFNVSSQDSAPRAFEFNPSGTKMYVVGGTNVNIFQYSLSTAYDISSASYDSVSFSISSEGHSSPSGLSFNSDGTKMYVVSSSADKVSEYALSTAYDISSASYSNSDFSLSGQDTNPYAIYFKPDGTKMYMAGATNTDIFQYSTGSTLATATFDTSTGNYFTHTPSADAEYGFSNAGDVQTFQLEVTGNQSVVPYSVSGTATTGSTYATTQGNSAGSVGLFVKPDGTKMYHSDYVTGKVYQHSLSTAWDLSTASYDGSSNDLSLSGQSISYPMGIFFKSDGSRLYVAATTTNRVFEYALSTAWDLSSASYSQQSNNFSSQTSNSGPHTLAFKPDGTKMYLSQTSSRIVYQYSLSTAWDTTSATYDSVSFSYTTFAPGSTYIYFKSDGTKLYLNGSNNGDLYEVDLSTAWDLSTASYNNVSHDYADGFSSNISIKPDGTKFFSITYSPASLMREYSMTASTPITITWDANIEWGGGTAPDSPASGQKDLYTITTDDGGTTYFGVPSGVAFS